ncbi:hypothetical protein [Rhizobium leguminosarum]|uniref:hypothetical protein n=1 Tax=Rhizobium leguminosarum TaxID=384 RepID=UPI0014415332|nr:hypothetical protein [Rhizobium leguminosarum]NKJ77782.1 hypothetical protein [Rhizobium leguminosarum bv. viciae]
MPEQLTLEMSAVEPKDIPLAESDIAESVLQAHGGNAMAAIELLPDADFLRGQLYTASCIMSAGMSRGWKPKYERV